METAFLVVAFLAGVSALFDIIRRFPTIPALVWARRPVLRDPKPDEFWPNNPTSETKPDWELKIPATSPLSTAATSEAVSRTILVPNGGPSITIKRGGRRSHLRTGLGYVDVLTHSGGVRHAPIIRVLPRGDVVVLNNNRDGQKKRPRRPAEEAKH